MTISPHLRLGNDALSHQVKADVTPIAKPEKRQKSPKGLSRKSQMERKPSKLKRGPVGHASAAQRLKVEVEGCRLTGARPAESYVVDPAHVTARTHGGCDDALCTVPLRRDLHLKYDRGELDLLPHLTVEEQSHAASHVGLLSAVKRTTGESYVPERLLRVVSDDGETS